MTVTYRNETELSRAVQARIRDHHRGHARKVHADAFGGKGEPDIDACVRGRAVKIELKMPGRRPTPEQYGALRRWAGAGALAGWATSVPEVDALLEHLDDLGWSNPQLAAEHRSDPIQLGTGLAVAAPARVVGEPAAVGAWSED